jgi:dTDP-4-dehydrorhamnose 3,5-epimerase
MYFTHLALPEVIRVEPKVFSDERGFFLESYHLPRFAEHGIPDIFVQDNHSCSNRGVVRGLHFQLDPFAQAKLVRVVKGAVFDVAVDIRPDSPTCGRWVGEYLTEENKLLLYIPVGFAHGFCALTDGTHVLYKASQVYSASHDRGLAWDDPDLGIRWPDPGAPFALSDKDRQHPRLRAWQAGGRK